MYFNSEDSNDELKFVFSEENIDSCSKFNQTFLIILMRLTGKKITLKENSNAFEKYENEHLGS